MGDLVDHAQPTMVTFARVKRRIGFAEQPIGFDRQLQEYVVAIDLVVEDGKEPLVGEDIPHLFARFLAPVMRNECFPALQCYWPVGEFRQQVEPEAAETLAGLDEFLSQRIQTFPECIAHLESPVVDVAQPAALFFQFTGVFRDDKDTASAAQRC